MNAIIIRPSDSPPVRVLEVDGPRHKYFRRDEGCYYLQTSNMPVCCQITNPSGDPDVRLKPWGAPFWGIVQRHDGSIYISAGRPTHQEAMRGDLHGRWGSLIYPKTSRTAFAIALRIARRLCKCNPMEGITLHWYEAAHLWRIETDLPVFQQSSPGHSIVMPK